MGRFLVDDSPVFPGYLQHCARLLEEPLSDENNREAARFLQRIINNTWQSAAKDDEQDLPTLRWWLVYAQMECEFWKAARSIFFFDSRDSCLWLLGCGANEKDFFDPKYYSWYRSFAPPTTYKEPVWVDDGTFFRGLPKGEGRL